ncbi:MAG: alkaline phosphatase D family protein [Polyangiaceae bacterium]
MRAFPRRRFLELTLVSAGAVLGPVACSSEQSARTSDAGLLFPQSVASGDPRPTSVVLWTRLADPALPNSDSYVTLEVAEDEAFSQIVSLDGEPSRRLVAAAEFDHCVKTRVQDLKPGTFYYYRFSYENAGVRATSRVGRTKTAPAEDADVSVRFAVVSCQDYAGKYFHCYRQLATLELDVIVHLGDYIYETTADPSFQTQNVGRQVTFSNPNEALSLSSSGSQYQAANSLGNYRDLYRLYRADTDLQAVHERFPIIAIQDDHEFSDDCHGDVAPYDDGRSDGKSLPRRFAADQAWFEYMPVDLSDAPTSDWASNALFPDDLRYYRTFVFGQHLELVMTDLRRYRPDHLVPEDAFPGSVFLTQAELLDLEGTLPESAVAYVDIGTYEDGAYREALRAGALQLGVRATSVEGLISVPFINDSLTTLGIDAPSPIDPTDPKLERGFAYHLLLKSTEFSRIGSRYVVALEPFEALAKSKYQASKGASEQLMGREQRAWFLDTMKASTRTFKVWGSEICMMSRHVDLTPVQLAPPELRQRITISAEDWDGFPNERAALLAELSALDNVVIVSGDLHCFFAGTPYANDDPKQRVVEFVTGSLTSTTWQDGLDLLASDPSLPASTKLLATSVSFLIVDPETRPNPHLAFQKLADNGFGVFEVNADKLIAQLMSVSTSVIATAPDKLEGPLRDLFSETRFEVAAGAADLFQDKDGMRARWDIASMTWRPAE